MENKSRDIVAYDLSFIPEQDRSFFESWEKGEVHLLSAILRIRQMHRANALPPPYPPQTP
jgi:hypothetical protein